MSSSPRRALCPLLLALLAAPAARAQSVDLPNVPLPSSEAVGPSLWFTAAELPALQARRTSPSAGPHYAATRAFVDGRLAALSSNPAGLTDDTLTQLSKGAALLQALGETPPAGAFAAYRDAATSALKRVASRSAATLLNPNPPDEIDVLQDSPRLQSMAEAYDLLRGSGVSASDDAAMRARIDNWAQALHDDLNLAGIAGVGGHRDNWGIKGGSALITAALALSSHPHAGGWMAFGNLLAHDSLAITGSSAGWYRESAHYLNYALDNLFSAAFQVQKRTGVDWFTVLLPFAQAALDLRQPDGSEAAFEEGVPAVFPFDVFAPRSPALGGQLAWAWNHSSKNTDSWPNQQLAEATQFLAGELPAEVAPQGRPSRFVEGGRAPLGAAHRVGRGGGAGHPLRRARLQREHAGRLAAQHAEPARPGRGGARAGGAAHLGWRPHRHHLGGRVTDARAACRTWSPRCAPCAKWHT